MSGTNMLAWTVQSGLDQTSCATHFALIANSTIECAMMPCVRSGPTLNITQALFLPFMGPKVP